MSRARKITYSPPHVRHTKLGTQATPSARFARLSWRHPSGICSRRPPRFQPPGLPTPTRPRRPAKRIIRDAGKCKRIGIDRPRPATGLGFAGDRAPACRGLLYAFWGGSCARGGLGKVCTPVFGGEMLVGCLLADDGISRTRPVARCSMTCGNLRCLSSPSKQQAIL